MKTTDVTTLRARRRRFLDALRSGEEVEILDRDVPVGRLVLVPVRPVIESKGIAPAWFERSRRAGVVRAGTLEPVTEILRGFSCGSKALGNAAVEALLDERRGRP